MAIGSNATSNGCGSFSIAGDCCLSPARCGAAGQVVGDWLPALHTTHRPARVLTGLVIEVGDGAGGC